MDIDALTSLITSYIFNGKIIDSQEEILWIVELIGEEGGVRQSHSQVINDFYCLDDLPGVWWYTDIIYELPLPQFLQLCEIYGLYGILMGCSGIAL